MSLFKCLRIRIETRRAKAKHIEKLYKNGLSIPQILRLTGFSNTEVTDVLHRLQKDELDKSQ